MSTREMRVAKVHKQVEPVRPQEKKPALQHDQLPVHVVAPQAANWRAEVNGDGLRPADHLALQRSVGNRGVRRIMAWRSANANDTQQERVTRNTSGLALQRNGDKPATVTPPGHGMSTAFGTYWIVPDLTDRSYQVEGEQITESDFAKLEKIWNALQSGTGKVQIGETDDKGVAYGGFKNMILVQFGKLMSKPLGRGLVSGLVEGSQIITIMPTSARSIASAKRGAGSEETSPGVKGAGGTTTIMLDADLKDDSVVASDAAGKEIAAPVFTVLGHELIHAQHNAAGQNRRSQAAINPAYSNREEEESISTGTLTENKLRSEHGLKPERFGHGGRDTR